MPCAECWAAAGVPYTPAADQPQDRASESSSAERVLKQLQERGELVSLPWELEKPKQNSLHQRHREQQLRSQRADHWEQEREQWKVKPQNFSDDQKRGLRPQLSNGNDACPKECVCSSRRQPYTWKWIDEITSGNCRDRSVSVKKSTSSKVFWRDNGARPLRLAQSDSRDAAAGATSEAQAGEATTSGSVHVKALGLLNKLFPFPEGSRFVPSMPTGLCHKQRSPPATAETSPTAADLDAAGGSSSRSCFLDIARQSPTDGVYGNKVKMEGQSRHQEETLDPSECQMFAGLNTSVATLQQADDVLLTGSLENLLLLEPPIVPQQTTPERQQQPFSGLQRSQKYTAQTQQMQGICGFRKQRNEFSQHPRWMQASSNSNSSSKSTDSNSSNDNCAPEIVPHSHCPRHFDGGSRSKRRPGISSCWHQTAALLHSLIATEDRPEPQQQHGHPATPHAAHGISRAAGVSESVVGGGGGAGADCLASLSSATIQKGCITPCTIGRASAATAASILQQQNVEADCCQSLPAEVARQILRRITSGAVQLHSQHEDEERMHTQEQTAERLQEHSYTIQELHQVQQEGQPVHGEGDGSTGVCCCSVSTCRSFCAYLLHLLGDIRTQRAQHERLQLLLLQLLLLLVQQHLACAFCRVDEEFVRHYRCFVVQQMGQLLRQQEQGEDEQLSPDLLLLDSHSLHHQKWVLLLLHLALLLRAWRTNGRADGSRCVIKVAYACLLHMDVCFELREGAADILAAAALDELSVAVQEAAVHGASDEAASWAGAEATASADIAATAGGGAAQGAGREAGALALCLSITKAAVEGRSAAAAAAAELAASVACCFLLMLQQSPQNEVFASRSTAVGLKVRPHVREFSVEAAAPAYPLLLLLLLPALEQQLLKGDALADTAATPLSLSVHAAETLHLVRISLFHAQQHLVGQLHSRAQGLLQPQQRVSMLSTLQQQLLLRVLGQQLMKFLNAAIRACTEQFDHLLSLLRREGPARSKTGRGSTSTSWSILEAAAAAAEAPLCCMCVLVQLPRLTLGGAAAENSAFDGGTLEVVVASLVNLLLRLIGSCSWETPAPAAREAVTEAAGTPAVAGSSVFVATAAFGCFSKLLVALTEAARSASMQIQKVTAAATAPDLPKGVSSAAEALQQRFACGAVAVLRFCLESAAAGHPVQQQEQVSEFIAAAADADIAILRFLTSCKEQPQLQQPLACQLLQQILQNPISDRGESNSSCNGRSSGGTNCSSSDGTASDSTSIIFIRSSAARLDTGDLHSSETICRSGREDLTAAAAAAADGAAVEPLACVAVDASTGTALQALARLLEDRKAAVASATAPSNHTAGGFSEAAAFSDSVADDAVVSAATAAASAGRLLRIAWTRVVGPALHEVCVHRPPAAVAAATKAEGLKATTGAKTSSKATEASVQAGQQHALAIIETRGSLINAFVSAVAAAASAATTAAGRSKRKKGVQYELQQLRELQRDFTVELQNATLAAALVVLSHEQPDSISCCDRSSNLPGSRSTSYWNTAQHQDPVGVLQQLLRGLLLHYSTEPTPMHSSSCCSRCSGGCLWRVILQVSVAVASLRPLVLQLFLWPLRYLLSLQREVKRQPERHIVEIWQVLYTCFSSGETAAAGAAPNNGSSNGCCCCGIVKLEQFLQQDDWVQVSDLILELLKLLHQTACSASAAAASAVPRLAAAAAAVERKAAAERADQRPPQIE